MKFRNVFRTRGSARRREMRAERRVQEIFARVAKLDAEEICQFLERDPALIAQEQELQQALAATQEVGDAATVAALEAELAQVKTQRAAIDRVAAKVLAAMARPGYTLADISKIRDELNRS